MESTSNKLFTYRCTLNCKIEPYEKTQNCRIIHPPLLFTYEGACYEWALTTQANKEPNNDDLTQLQLGIQAKNIRLTKDCIINPTATAKNRHANQFIQLSSEYIIDNDQTCAIFPPVYIATAQFKSETYQVLVDFRIIINLTENIREIQKKKPLDFGLTVARLLTRTGLSSVAGPPNEDRNLEPKLEEPVSAELVRPRENQIAEQKSKSICIEAVSEPPDSSSNPKDAGIASQISNSATFLDISWSDSSKDQPDEEILEQSSIFDRPANAAWKAAISSAKNHISVYRDPNKPRIEIIPKFRPTKRTIPITCAADSQAIHILDCVARNSSAPDLILVCHGERFYGQRNVFMERSHILADILLDGRTTLDVSDSMDAKTVRIFVNYIYTRRVERLVEFCYFLLPIAETYHLQHLKEIAERMCCTLIREDTVILLLTCANANNANILKSRCFEFLSAHYEMMSQRSTFQEAMRMYPELDRELNEMLTDLRLI